MAGVAITTMGGVIDESRPAHAARVDAVGAAAPPADVERGAEAASPSASASATSLWEICEICEIASTSICEMATARSSPVWKTCGKADGSSW